MCLIKSLGIAIGVESDIEKSIMSRVEEQCKLILSNKNNKKLFEKFFQLYGKNDFKSINFLRACEEQMLISMFDDNSLISFSTGDNTPSLFCEERYPPLIKFLVKNGILQKNSEENRYNEFYNYLLITVCLKYISQEYFANTFNELYGGFFEGIWDLDIDECIEVYFSIDFIVHESHENISHFIYFLSEFNQEFNSNSGNLEVMISTLKEKALSYLEDRMQNDFEKRLMAHGIQEQENIERNPFDNIKIEDVDQLDGIEFEHFISYLFEGMGYSVIVTPASGDQGIDIIVAKQGVRLGVQAKRYITPVTNTAIQEVVAGIGHYNLQKGIVVTNSNYTKSAIELAKSNDVILWDRNKLIEIIQTVKSMNNFI